MGEIIESTNKKTVNSVLDSQRKESEVRDLLQELEKLISLSPERKLRWVWELVQNGMDCAVDNKVNISFTLTKNKLVFEHDGEPFKIENLVALVRKTSTKPEGKVGKFGTGFVSTHVLCKKVTVSGLLQNEDGYRPFSLLIDRSFDSLPALTKALDEAYKEIDAINEKPAICDIQEIKTKYEYDLEDYKFSIAKDALGQLRQNLSFTLLINNEQLSSVTIDDEGSSISFSIDNPQQGIADIGFSKIQRAKSNHSENEIGLLYKRTDALTIAFPVTKNGDHYSLIKIEDQARIFRNFPLIGTEKFRIPCLAHSALFQPTEPRDGIRTLKDREDRADKHADENREVLKLYASLFQSAFSQLAENKIGNLHLLAESGLPDDTQNYLAKDWFETSIQKPLREFLLKHELVRTAAGSLIKIEDARFIKTHDLETEEEFYEIVSEFFPSSCPDKESYRDWKTIIEQDEEKWLKRIYISIEDVIQEVERTGNLDSLKIADGDPVQWLNKLIDYILKINKVELTEQYAVYPNQLKAFKKRLDLKLDPGFDEKIKNISKNIFRNLSDELILGAITNQDGIQKFETAEYFLSLNTFIGQLDCNKAKEEQVNSIFELGCYFKGANAPKRTEWFGLTNVLLPTLSEKKLSASILEDFNFEPTDKWTLKYVSLLIDKSKDLGTFANTYFEKETSKAIDWLNRFLAFVCRNEESRDIAFKFAIVLTQDGKFKKNENLIRENNPDEFEVIFKDMINDYLGKGDPREYLVDNRITNEYLQEDNVQFLTFQIDKRFSQSDIEKSVEENGNLNPLFHKLNDWFTKEEEKKSAKPKLYFPIFNGKRSDLSVIAFGKDISQMVAEKGIQEVKQLSKLKKKSSELSQLEHAADLAGGTLVLMSIAQEIHNEAERIEWRKKVGTAAENAFFEAMQDIETNFDIENPDCGKDFTIISKTTGKEFYIEIKSTIIGEEVVTMSPLQGQTAKDEKHRYALCVITRPSGTMITKDYFLQHVKFVPTIGELIGDKLSNIISDLKKISEHETGDDVNVAMDRKTYSVFIKKKTWESGISFPEFVTRLQAYLTTPE